MYWRRNSFNKAPFDETKPKWHISVGQPIAFGLNFGLCGYEYNSTLSSILIRSDVKNPKLICKKCLDLTQI